MILINLWTNDIIFHVEAIFLKPNLQQIIEFCHSNTIIDTLGITVNPCNDSIYLELLIEERHTNFCDICHGGVLTTMADTAMGIVCNAQNKSVVTMSLSIDFIKPVLLKTKIVAVPKIIHNGRQTMVCECDIVDDNKKLYAKVHATFFVIGKFIKTE